MSATATIWACFVFTLVVIVIDAASVIRTQRSARKKLILKSLSNDE